MYRIYTSEYRAVLEKPPATPVLYPLAQDSQAASSAQSSPADNHKSGTLL